MRMKEEEKKEAEKQFFRFQLFYIYNEKKEQRKIYIGQWLTESRKEKKGESDENYDNRKMKKKGTKRNGRMNEC